MFGDWLSRVDALAEQFASAEPFPHVVVDGFFDADAFASLRVPTPVADPELTWHEYDNPLERKITCNALPPDVAEVFDRLAELAPVIGKISGIDGLRPDPHLLGAGVHAYHPDGGRLDWHLDFSRHAMSGLERRLNLIIFVNREWDPEWGGQLSLNNEPRMNSPATAHLSPAPNRAVLFRTTEDSFHGVLRPVRADEHRLSLAYYYMSDPRPGIVPREKARFYADLDDPEDERLDRLREIRVHRRLEPSDYNA